MANSISDDKPVKKKRRGSPSLFGAVILIAIGIYFLLYNMDLVPSPNWGVLWQIWPLFLIFLGLEIFVQQIPSPWGSLLSIVLAFGAIAIFVYALLYGDDNSLFQEFGIPDIGEIQSESISYAPGEIQSAVVDIDFSSFPANLYELEDSNDLIAGEVFYFEDLVFETSASGDEAFVRVDSTGNVASWFSPKKTADDEEWQIGFNPDVQLELSVDVASGPVNLDLSALQLTRLTIAGGSGSVEARLPDGDYEISYDGSSGAMLMILPANGQLAIDIAGSSGHTTLGLPETMEARVVVSDGSGSFDLPRERFSQISGEKPDEGVWVTANYEGSTNQIDLQLDIGSGAVQIITE